MMGVSFKVAVLMGGMSAEREVSLMTGEAIAGALRELGHDAVEVDAGPDLASVLAFEKPDVAFMALHGRFGEDGTVQGLLEVMRIPYTGCGVLASAVTLDKIVTKQLLRFNEIPVADDVESVRGDSPVEVLAEVEERLGFPVMVKPACEGSSIGVTRVTDGGDLEPALEEVFEYDDRVLIEEYIDGRHLTVGIIGQEPIVLPVLEITTDEGFYDYRAKYEPGRTSYEVPARLSEEMSDYAKEIALKSFDVLLCEDMSRIDMMLQRDTDRLVVLEVNTIPGMTEMSLVPKAAGAIGMTFPDVVAEVLRGARLKVGLRRGEREG